MEMQDLDNVIEKMQERLTYVSNTITRLRSRGVYTDYNLYWEIGAYDEASWKELYERCNGLAPELDHDALRLAQRYVCVEYKREGITRIFNEEKEIDNWYEDFTFDEIVEIYEDHFKVVNRIIEDTRFSLHAVQLACVKLLLEKHTEEEVVKELQYVLVVNEQDACELIEEYRGLANG